MMVCLCICEDLGRSGGGEAPHGFLRSGGGRPDQSGPRTIGDLTSLDPEPNPQTPEGWRGGLSGATNAPWSHDQQFEKILSMFEGQNHWTTGWMFSGPSRTSGSSPAQKNVHFNSDIFNTFPRITWRKCLRGRRRACVPGVTLRFLIN